MRAQLIRKMEVGPELSEWVSWMVGLDLRPVTKSTYVHGRTEKWFRWASNLRSIANGRHTLSRCEEPPDFVRTLGDAELLGWSSLLVCGFPTSIGPHRDHGCFEREAVMLNVGRARYTETVRGRDESIELEDGLYSLDIGVIHRSEQLDDIRFNATFRRIKPNFLTLGG